MNLLTHNNSPWIDLRGLFGSKQADRTVLKDDSTPLGINRTVFEGNVINYAYPLMPFQLHTTKELITKFGIKGHSRSFKKITLALNSFKSN
jgi:hypothetical protein